MSALDVPLRFEGLDEDVELPFGDPDDVSTDDTLDTIETAEEAGLDAHARRLELALANALHHLQANTVPSAARIRSWWDLAGIPAHDAHLTPTERRDDGIARAAAKWTDDEVRRVDKAIADVAAQAAHDARTRHVGDGLAEFTTADVWAELGDGFPVTKGIAGRMLAAKATGLIANTGRTVIAPKDATGPNHGQRLTVWRAL